MISELFNIDFLLLGIAITGNLVLGFVVLFNKKKSTTNRLLFAFAVVNSIWSLVTYLSYSVTDKQLAVWLVRFVMFFATIHGSLFFFLVNAFPGETLRIKKKYVYLIIPLVILTMALSLTPFLFSDIDFVPGRAPQPKPAPGIIVFIFVTISAILSGITSLIKRTVQSSKAEKNHYKYLLIGAIIMFASILSFDFILPSFFNDTRFIPLSALFTLPFVISISYAIIKHKLFNVKVAGTAVLVFALSIVGFIEVTQTDNIVSMIYRSAVLFFILVFGILLIKSVLKEVRQREEIAAMAEDVRRAYVVEKKAKEELEKLDKAKNEYLQHAQHDLRTPLTKMKYFLDLLLAGTLGKQNKKTIEMSQRIQSSVEDSIEEVNDFLDINKFKIGKSPILLQPGVELVPILEKVIDRMKNQAESKGIYLKFEKLEKQFKIKADIIKLKAVFKNIIDNAIKYTPKGGITVNIKEQTPNVIITIKDTGIGIIKEKITTLFETQFERTKQAERMDSGMGIGLFHSAKIVKGHNGRIWAESEGEGKGSIFYIELPIGGQNSAVVPVTYEHPRIDNKNSIKNA